MFCFGGGAAALDLSGDLGLGVGDLDAELLGLGDDVDPLPRGDVVGNLRGEGAVVHEKELDVLGVADKEGLVAGGHHVAGLLVGAEADRGHGSVAPEPSADTVVDTLRLAPFRRQTVEPVGLMSVEGLRALLDDRNVLLGGNHLD